MMTFAFRVRDLHQAIVDYLELHRETDLNTEKITNLATTISNERWLDLSVDERAKLITHVVDRMVGWGPLTSILADPSVTEIMVNGAAHVYVERGGTLVEAPNTFLDDSEVMQVINRMVGTVGRRIDTSSPLVDARLPDGSRVNAIIAPLALSGPTLTIRRFPAKPMTTDDLVTRGTSSREMVNFLTSAVAARCNVVVSGGTGGGKTTTLAALASCIPHSQRIITIEDTAEMRINHPHLVGLESRPQNLEGKGEIPVRVLLKNALRMRPDRIIVGEIRGAEALDMLQAMNTGHQGSFTTVHANAPLEALLRIETMALMADVALPIAAIRTQVRQAIQLVVHQERGSDGTRRIVAIHALSSERPEHGDDSYTLHPLYWFDYEQKQFRSAPPPNSLRERLSSVVGSETQF